MLLSIMISSNILCAVHAQNTTGNSTAPARLGWVPSNTGRSTMDIVWSCFSVLLICSYKCIHVNLPSFEEKHAKWHRVLGIPLWPHQLIRMKAYRKINLMAFVLLAPEIGVGMALAQYLAARMALEEARKAVPELELTLIHGFYATMGGFGCTVAMLPRLSGTAANSPYSQYDESMPFITPEQQAHRRQADRSGASGFDDRGIEDDKVIYQGGSRLGSINLTSYAKLCRTLLPDSDLIVSEANLSDRSKSDVVTKILAISQSIWLIVQSVNRVAHGLPLAELELATMAYILCAIVMYALWWWKPFDAEHMVLVPMQDQGESLGIEFQPLLLDDRVQNLSGSALWEIMGMRLGQFTGSDMIDFRQALFYGTATVFSAIHLLAWHWDFSSIQVRTLWRLFGALSTVSGLALLTQSIFQRYWSHREDIYHIALFEFLSTMYLVSRIGIIILVFFSFHSMPSAVYDTVDLWPSYWPHLS